MSMRERKIAPSLMCADFVNLKGDLDVLAAGGAGYLHFDIMDGHYVPNFTLGIDFCRAVARYTRAPLDIHLMIEDVDRYGPDFAALEEAVVTFHPEVSYHPQRTVQLLKSLGARVGIAVDPAMPLSQVLPLLPDVDLLCIMTVNPGYAGQKLLPRTLDKLAEAARFVKAEGLPVEIEVDGNVSWANLPRMLEAGAEVFVAGTSSLFDGKQSLAANLAKMRELLDAAPEANP